MVVKAGTTILVEKPFAFILCGKENGIRCDQCFTKGKVLKCSGCQHIHYCGKSCQKEAWPEHKAECVGFRRVAPRVPTDAARLLARLVRRLAAGGAHTRGHYTESKFRVWKDLMSHYHDLKEDTRRMDHFTSLCAILFQFLTDITIPNSVELMGIYGRMVINGFTILDPEMLTVGTGVYMGVSIMDHSCEPNAVAVFQGTTINIRTLVDMPTVDFSKIRISYIDLLSTPFERQTELKSSYYFLCQCSRCLDEYQISLMHAAKCPNPKCDFPVQIPWRDDVQLVIRCAESNAHQAHHNGDAKTDDMTFQKQVENTRSQPENTERSLSNGAKKTNGNYRSHNGHGSDRRLSDVSEDFKEMSLESDEEVDNPECPKCGEVISEDFVMKFREVMDFTTLQLLNMKNKFTTYVDVCRACLDRQENVLHPMNLLHVQTLDMAMDGCLQYELWEPARQYAQQLVPGFKNYYGEMHPMYGLLLVKLGKLETYAGRPDKALAALRGARDTLHITHGASHSLCRDNLAPLLRQAEADVAATMRF